MRLLTLLFAAALVGCDGETKDTGITDTSPDAVDEDGDGYSVEDGDCDDGDATVHPDAPEVWYDGVDQNCDERSDEDQDQDGYDRGDDCDDEEDDISPGAPEVCDGLDNDCNEQIDEVGDQPVYTDADQDGFGTGEVVGYYCTPPEGTALTADDCNDTDAATNPGAVELCDGLDNNCDTAVDEGASDARTVYTDADLDGFGDPATGTAVCGEVEGTVEDGTDCDDVDVLTYPGAPEICDLKDNDCDAVVDEDATDDRTYYQDADADGYGDPSVTVEACGLPTGYAEADTDCDDADATLSPGATEVCDGIDNDCDGETDSDSPDATVFYADADADGYGDEASTVASCEAAVDGYVSSGGDCDDASADVSPAASELCDGIDNNCDASTDEATATDAPTWYLDADSDTYGDVAGSTSSCEQPAGFVASDEDCNDVDADINPAAVEVCDGVDNDCTGVADDGAGDATTWYADADGDSWGDASTTSSECEQPEGYVSDATDCDDTDALTYPGAAETCDETDEDCDGTVDNDVVDGVTVYADTDGDGFGDAVLSAIACDASSGWVYDATDCDDGAAAVNPDATEACDGIDNDCDGDTDDASASDASTWYADDDSDGFGDPAVASTACEAPTGTVADATDCDDAAAAVYPGATETCDDVDQDCDGTVDDDATDADTWYADADSDGYGDSGTDTEACDQPSGYVANATDCDDDASSVNPGETEVCDDIDNDCDDDIDEAGATGESTWYVDADGDGYGVSDTTDVACNAPAGYADNAEDCDDDESTANPGASELDDGLDNDCDGTVDEGFVLYGDVIITEIDRQPRVGGSSTNNAAAWFEVYNTTSDDIDLSDWYIQRESSSLAADAFYVDPDDDVILGANSYAVFCKTDTYTAASTSYSDLVCDYYWGDESEASTYVGTYHDNTFNMQRDEDELTLWYGGDDASGTLIDAVAWTYDATDGYWPRDATRSTQLDPGFLDADENDDLDNWCSTTNNVYFQWYYASASAREFGTPGIGNHTCP